MTIINVTIYLTRTMELCESMFSYRATTLTAKGDNEISVHSNSLSHCHCRYAHTHSLASSKRVSAS